LMFQVAIEKGMARPAWESRPETTGEARNGKAAQCAAF